MSAPIKNTCPDIDKVIIGIKMACQAAKNGRKEHPEADDYFWDILYNIEDLEGKLNDLRHDNEALREWGHTLDGQLQSAAEEIDRLEHKSPLN